MTATSVGEEQVVLVDEQDRETGSYGKLAVHREGLLHRAVSVMLFDSRGRVLLQRRAATKYHSAGLWANSCCGHPRVGESVLACAARRLQAELGISGVQLAVAGQFTYRAQLANGLVEHELDHVVTGLWDGDPQPHPDEVDRWRWMYPEEITDEMALTPQRFAAWTSRVLRIATGDA